MGKNKLKKFEELKTFACVFEYPFARLQAEKIDIKGKWREKYFGNDNPIVLELGCGKGEYTTGLAEVFPDKNFIGIDIKGARIWKGAKHATMSGMKNVAFLRTDIELLPEFFAPSEVDEIWITFPDPQMKKVRKRLISSRFLAIYSAVMRSAGIVHLKTDSPFLFTFASRLLDFNGINPITIDNDIYGNKTADPLKSIKTFYEQQWLSRGKKIKLVEFALPCGKEFVDPDESDIEPDDYRSIPRGNFTLPSE